MSTNATAPADMRRMYELYDRWMAYPRAFPISFTYNGRKYNGLPESWARQTRARLLDTNITGFDYTAQDPDTGLRITVECLRYKDFPVLEWTVYFTNCGIKDTPILEDAAALNGEFYGANPVLITNNGDFGSRDGYASAEHNLSVGTEVTQIPSGGRPCDQAFPYQRLLFDGYGLHIAIGWPGSWRTRWEGSAGGARLWAGQDTFHTLLHPGETFRTPRMTVFPFEGDLERGVNLWRRWYLAHVLPRRNGAILRPMANGTFHGSGDEYDEVCRRLAAVCGVEYTMATEQNQLENIPRPKADGFDLDAWWIDAGWYPCTDDESGERLWPITGTWEPDQDRFPNGLASIGAKCAENGMDFLLWFEPERVALGAWLDKDHPEWLLRHDPGSKYGNLLNLANRDALEWLKEHVNGMIQEYGIRIYRQDYNDSPLEYWRGNEPEDRKGALENLHVQGYLEYYDFLLANNPDLLIDSCASGGRRNDLETMRRAVPLHQTDYGYGEHPVKQAFYQTLYSWIPYFRGYPMTWEDENGEYRPELTRVQIDNYSIINAMTPFTTIYYDETNHDYALKMYKIWRKAAPFMLYGDFYALTPYHKSRESWTAWQFDDPDWQRGVIQMMRNNACEQEAVILHPRAVDENAAYVFENEETGESFEINGAELAGAGAEFRLPRRSGAIWFYNVKN